MQLVYKFSVLQFGDMQVVYARGQKAALPIMLTKAFTWPWLILRQVGAGGHRRWGQAGRVRHHHTVS